jgi:hypothetical protein
MRGTRSLGLALVAAALGAAPALAQQQNTGNAPQAAPTTITPAPSATNPNTGSDKTAAVSNGQSNTAPTDQTAITNQTTTDQSAAASTNQSTTAPADQTAGTKHPTTDKNAAANPAPSATTAPPPSDRSAANPPQDNTAANTNNTGPTGSLQKYNDEWRTSKVVGATVFNSKGDSIGSINDMLMDDSGKVIQVIISTGGVLGIGGKLVAVPFEQLKFQESANDRAATRSTEAANNTRNAPAGSPAPVVSNPPRGSNAPVANADRGNAPPVRYSVVLPDATKDTLNKQQEFKYASND